MRVTVVFNQRHAFETRRRAGRSGSSSFHSLLLVESFFRPLDGSVEQFDSLIEMFRAPAHNQTDAVL